MSKWTVERRIQMHHRSIRAHWAWAAAVLTGMLLPGRGTADDIKPLSPTDTAYGLSLTQWATAWFQWEFSMPAAGNPADDYTGLQSGIGQHLPVWFLPRTSATLNRTITRAIYVPDGCGILFAGTNKIDAGAQPGQYSDDVWIQEEQGNWQSWLSGIKTYEVSLDGASIPSIEQYRVHTPLFTIVIPPNNIMQLGNVQAGKDNRAVAIGDGDFLLLPPLSIGKHVLTYHIAGLSSPEAPYDTTGVYNLIIQDPNKPAE
jgi:hypothetical protein